MYMPLHPNDNLAQYRKYSRNYKACRYLSVAAFTIINFLFLEKVWPKDISKNPNTISACFIVLSLSTFAAFFFARKKEDLVNRDATLRNRM